MKNKYYITPTLAVDQFAAIKLADLSYKEDSTRNDDCGSLYVAPFVATGWDAPLGMLAIYATTNGDPILLGQIEEGEVAWINEVFDDNDLIAVLHRASWNHPSSGEGYSYIVEDSLPQMKTEDID